MNKMKDKLTNDSLFFVKVVAFLQQNWAYLDIDVKTYKTTILFISDSRMIFDKKCFDHYDEAISKLRRNGFDWYLDPEKEHKNFLTPPKGAVIKELNPIYSSGKFWK